MSRNYKKHLKQVILTARPLSSSINLKISVLDERDSSQNDLYERWKAVFNGDPSYIEKRLEFDSLTPSDLKSLHMTVGQLTKAEQDQLVWLKQTFAYSGKFPLNSSLAKIPFATVLQPFVCESMADIKKSIHPRLAAKSAISDLTVTLTKQLSAMSSSALYKEFDLARSTSSSSFDQFNQNLLQGGWIDIFAQYPVLARLISQTCIQWCNFIQNLFQRIKRDEKAIKQLSQSENNHLFPIQSIRPLGDIHGGQCVLLLELANGSKIVYKPRPMAIDARFNKWLDLLNSNYQSLELGPLFGTLRTINRGEYGYQEWAIRNPVDTKQEARDAFIRYGALLAVLHLLRGTDAHFENIIVSGAFPILIDAETLFHPDSPAFSFAKCDSDQRQITFTEEIWLSSCQRVGLLPNPRTNHHNNSTYDFSALGYLESKPANFLYFQHINSDSMQLAEVKARSTPLDNTVKLRDKIQLPCDYVAEIEQGFETTCDLMQQLRDSESTESLLAEFKSCKSRILFRNTSIYGKTIANSTYSDNLASGITHSFCFEPLALPFCIGKGAIHRWPIFLSEQKQLEKLDIPYFLRFVDSRDFFDAEGTLVANNFFPRSGFDDAVHAIDHLTPETVRQESRIIRGTLTASRMNSAIRTKNTTSVTAQSSQSMLVEHALNIADEIASKAVFAPGGSINWFAIQLGSGGQTRHYGPLSESFYSGRLGVAFFLACIQKQSPFHSRYEEIIEGCLRETKQAFLANWSREALAHAFGGGLTGLGGAIYSLLTLGIFTDDNSLVDAAVSAASTIKRSFLQSHTSFDLFNGIAGLLLSLSTLHQFTGDTNVLRPANCCSEFLVANAQQTESGVRWTERKGTPQIGLGHGNSGIAMAMMAYSAATGDEQSLASALAAIHDEDLRLEQLYHNSDITNDSMIHSLCRGSSGILLARIRCAEFDQRFLPSSTVVNLWNERSNSKIGSSLCCGHSGEWLTGSAMNAWNVKHHQKAPKKKLPDLAFDLEMNDHDDPSLFRGWSGYGLSLLSQACPDFVPCIVSMQLPSDRIRPVCEATSVPSPCT